MFGENLPNPENEHCMNPVTFITLYLNVFTVQKVYKISEYCQKGKLISDIHLAVSFTAVTESSE